jgi:hypothetical protein
VADLEEALAGVPDQLAGGFTSICFKPSMFTDDADEVPALCARVVDRVRELAGGGQPGVVPSAS